MCPRVWAFSTGKKICFLRWFWCYFYSSVKEKWCTLVVSLVIEKCNVLKFITANRFLVYFFSVHKEKYHKKQIGRLPERNFVNRMKYSVFVTLKQVWNYFFTVEKHKKVYYTYKSIIIGIFIYIKMYDTHIKLKKKYFEVVWPLLYAYINIPYLTRNQTNNSSVDVNSRPTDRNMNSFLSLLLIEALVALLLHGDFLNNFIHKTPFLSRLIKTLQKIFRKGVPLFFVLHI